VSEHIIGLTLVAFATSLPELIVSCLASFSGHGDTAWGNVIGSNMMNIGLVLGIAAIIMPLKVGKDSFKDALIVLLITLLIFLFVILDGELSFFEGLMLLLIYPVYIYYLRKRNVEEAIPCEKEGGMAKNIFLTAIGISGIIFGAELLIVSAVGIAEMFGISEVIIAMTIVAIGTSLPELSTSITASIKKRYGLAVGNIIGSNIINMTLVLGSAAAIKSITPSSIFLPMIAVLILSLSMVVLCRKKLNKLGGIALLVMYIFLLTMIMLS